MQNDDDLRERFSALASEAESAAPELTTAHIGAWRSAIRVQPRPRMRVGTMIGIAAGGVVTLTIGLVLGASTGYASAEEVLRARGEPMPSVRPGLAVLRNIPPLIFSCGEPPRVAQLPPVQQGVPIIDLPVPTTRTASPLSGVLGIRQVANGNILVNDAGARQVRLFDSTLALQGVVRDSMPGTATSYGPRRLPMMAFVGDSSLMVDYQGQTIMVLGPAGQVVRAMAPLSDDMLAGLAGPHGKAVDSKGRIIFNGRIQQDVALGLARAKIPDSALVVRADLDARRLDTIARIKNSGTTRLMGREGNGPVRFFSEPVPLTDDWAVLADGSIAVVRGQDYHIDWIRPDGSTFSASKMPFDWKRFTDEDKQHLIDSIRTNGIGRGMRVRAPNADVPAAAGARGAGGGAGEQMVMVPTEYIAPALNEIFDFHPPIRDGAVMPDLDGNVWILPTSTAQSKAGELVYDVVNIKGDFHRVRLPAGRVLAGFGKSGAIFLLAGDKANGFYLEKTRLPSKR